MRYIESRYAVYLLSIRLLGIPWLPSFNTTPSNYGGKISDQQIPQGLRAVIAELFKRQAITSCSGFGNTIELQLQQDGMLSSEALVTFLQVFSDITGGNIGGLAPYDDMYTGILAQFDRALGVFLDSTLAANLQRLSNH